MSFSLKTRERYVQLAETRLEEKRQHCEFCTAPSVYHQTNETPDIEVVKVFRESDGFTSSLIRVDDVFVNKSPKLHGLVQ